MHKTRLLIITASACALNWAESDAQTIRMDPIVTVATGEAEHPLYEPHVAINPANPSHLVAVAIVHGGASVPFAERIKLQKCAAFLSLDAGATWTRHDFPTTRCFDPWAVILPDGRAVVTVLGEQASLPQLGEVGLFAFRSADGGRTWEDAPLGVGRNHDHSTMVVDQNPGPRQGWIYLSSNHSVRTSDGVLRNGFQMIRSRNGGKFFDDPVQIAPNNLNNFAEMPVVLPDGTLVESFVDATFFPDSGKAERPEVLFDRRRAWVIRSTDGGSTFSTPMFVTDACGPPPGYRLSAFAADLTTGTYARRLYFVCREKGGGPILLTYSRDGGESWTPARAVHAASPVNGRIPGVVVNDRGVVLVSWSETSGRTPACEQRVYVAASLDGGDSFSPSQLVASSPACSTGGDYFGLIAAPDGRFRLVWSEMGDRGLKTTTIDLRP